MKNTTVLASALRSALAGSALALAALPSQAGVDVQLNVGVPVVAPAPVMVAPGPVGVPSMVWSPEYGAYIAVDFAQPLLYIGGVYYFFNGGVWLSGPNYWGPWVGVRRLPRALGRFQPRDWDHVRGMARGHMADPHWRQFRPGPQPGGRGDRGDHGGRGDERGHEPGPGREHERERP